MSRSEEFSQGHSPESKYRLTALSEDGRGLSLNGPGPDPTVWKNFDRLGEALKHVQSVTEAHPFKDDETGYSETTAPISEYHLTEGNTRHRLAPGTAEERGQEGFMGGHAGWQPKQ